MCTLYFIQLQFSVNWWALVFPEHVCNFFSKITLHVFLNFLCNHSLSLICTGLHVKFVWTSNKVYLQTVFQKLLCLEWDTKFSLPVSIQWPKRSMYATHVLYYSFKQMSSLDCTHSGKGTVKMLTHLHMCTHSTAKHICRRMVYWTTGSTGLHSYTVCRCSPRALVAKYYIR